MLPLAKGTAGPDPQDDIKGYALQILWPDHLSAVDLFGMIAHPNEGYSGSYVLFLNYMLPDSLSPDDLPPALTWANGFVAQTGYNGDFHRKSLADAVLFRAWKHLDLPAVLAGVITYVRTCLAQGGELLRGTDHKDQDAFRQGLKTDTRPRRTFLLALAREAVEPIDVYGFLRSSLLQHQDLIWLLELAPGGAAADPTLNQATLCTLVQSAFKFDHDDHFAALYDSACHWPLLWQRYRFTFEGIPLDSPEAEQERRFLATTQSFRVPKRPPLSPSPPERVAAALERFEAGTWRAFWWLNAELTLAPESHVYTPDRGYEIRSLPGWAAADAATRQRIVQAAERYLIIGKTSVMSWMGTGRLFANDTAALRAFILLKQEDPGAYDAIAPAVWAKWAPTLASLPQNLGDQAPTEQNQVLVDALTQAPERFVATIRTLVHRERMRTAKEGKIILPGTSFFHLRDLKACWQSKPLCEGVFAELGEADNTEDQFSVLLEMLLTANYAPARDYAVTELAAGRLGSFTLAASTALASHCPLEAWPTIWPMLTSDTALARAFFLALATRYTFHEGPFSALSERDLGAFYVLMMRLFPVTDDPQHKAGEAHFMGPADLVGHLRDSLPGLIIGRGTMAAVLAMRDVVCALPDTEWLVFRLRDAEQIMLMKTWAPLSPLEIRALVASPEHQLVQSAEDLCELLVATLRRYEESLHGEQTPVRALWDRQQGGDWFRPVEEDALSDHVKLYLEQALEENGVIANREVEIGRILGAPIGRRTDIRIDAIRRGPENTPLDTITAVIETKGCWNKGLFTALRNQLYDDYMKSLGAPIGIYLVGWFDKVKWDPTDKRCANTPDTPIATIQSQLDTVAAHIAAGAELRVVVLDCHAP